jgi:hypothetical protein
MFKRETKIWGSFFSKKAPWGCHNMMVVGLLAKGIFNLNSIKLI